jgi:indole-3-glycerol phosphate synthase
MQPKNGEALGVVFVSLLNEIMAHKRQEITEHRTILPLQDVRQMAEDRPPALDFVGALRSTPTHPALIAEVKRASPSRGVLRADLDPLPLAKIYSENGAAAISVLTDQKYFQGQLDDLQSIADRFEMIPLLRKDFICDPYQVYEARAAGAAAVLLIVAALSQNTLFELYTHIHQCGMDALIEVHSEEELERALALSPELVGINNRDLRDFSIDLATTVRLRALIPEEICVVAESGIHTRQDVAEVSAAGADAILVGEALVRAEDIGAQVRQLTGG